MTIPSQTNKMAHLFMTNLLLDSIKKICNGKTFSKRIKNKIYSQLKFSQKKKKISNKKYGKIIKERENTERKYVQKT